MLRGAVQFRVVQPAGPLPCASRGLPNSVSISAHCFERLPTTESGGPLVVLADFLRDDPWSWAGAARRRRLVGKCGTGTTWLDEWVHRKRLAETHVARVVRKGSRGAFESRRIGRHPLLKGPPNDSFVVTVSRRSVEQWR
jgi:hypothetical protein